MRFRDWEKLYKDLSWEVRWYLNSNLLEVKSNNLMGVISMVGMPMAVMMNRYGDLIRWASSSTQQFRL